METPCIFLVFNRPALTSRVLDQIRLHRPKRLFVVADGPRLDHPTDPENCRLVRDVVARGVDWPCELVRDYAQTNLGCARRVSSGITSALASVEEAIILEDDCIPNVSFFPFCEELLNRYRNVTSVGQIAGYTFIDRRAAGNASYHFSRYPHCWGWATWRRAWNCYDHTMNGCLDNDGLGWLDAWIPNSRERAIWKKSFIATARGEIDSWAYRWTYSLWRHKMLSANASYPVVENLGFGSDATHTRQGDNRLGRKSSPLAFPIVHPYTIAACAPADDFTSRAVFRPPGLFRRLLGRACQMIVR